MPTPRVLVELCPKKASTMSVNRKHACLAIAFWVMVWQAIAMLANRSLLIPLPTPVSTLGTLLRMVQAAAFWQAVGLSLLRIGMGFLAALMVGTVGAGLCVKSRLFHALTAPILQLLRAVPVAATTVVVFLWVKREDIPSLIAFLTVLPMIWNQLETGMRQLNGQLLEAAQVFALSKRVTLRRIVLPELRPYFAAAITTGIGFAWKSGVAAEVICRIGSSLGDLLWVGKSSVDYDEVFAVTIVIVLLSIALQRLSKWLLKEGTT